MRKCLIFCLSLFLHAPLWGGIDNYLFVNKPNCQRCVKEIEEKQGVTPSVSYKCRGRYGEKSGSKYYLTRLQRKSEETELEVKYSTASRERTRSLSFLSIQGSAQGMNERDIKRLCPRTYLGSGQ